MKTPNKTIDELLADGAAVDRAMREAVRQALLRHKRLGQPIVVWENGQVVEVPADRIDVSDAPEAPAADPHAPEAA